MVIFFPSAGTDVRREKMSTFRGSTVGYSKIDSQKYYRPSIDKPAGLRMEYKATIQRDITELMDFKCSVPLKPTLQFPLGPARVAQFCLWPELKYY